MLNFPGIHLNLLILLYAFFFFPKLITTFLNKDSSFCSWRNLQGNLRTPRLFRHKGHGSIDLEGVNTRWSFPGAAGFWTKLPWLSVRFFKSHVFGEESGKLGTWESPWKRKNIPIYSVILEESGIHQCSSPKTSAPYCFNITDCWFSHTSISFFGGVGTTVFPNPPVLGHQGIVTVIIPHLFGDDAAGQLSSSWGDQHRSCFQVDQISSLDTPERHMSSYLGDKLHSNTILLV